MKTIAIAIISILGTLAPLTTPTRQEGGRPTVPATPTVQTWVAADHTEHLAEGLRAEFTLQLSAPFLEMDTGRVARVASLSGLFSRGAVALQRQHASQFVMGDSDTPLTMVQQALDPEVALFFAQELLSPGSAKAPTGPEPEGQWIITAAPINGSWGTVAQTGDIAWSMTFEK